MWLVSYKIKSILACNFDECTELNGKSIWEAKVYLFIKSCEIVLKIIITDYLIIVDSHFCAKHNKIKILSVDCYYFIFIIFFNTYLENAGPKESRYYIVITFIQNSDSV